jgi:outer membrane protein with beta-barrel domain
MRVARTLISIVLLGSVASPVLCAQDYEPGPDNKFNSNLAFAATAPLNPMAKYAHVGWGFTYGAGYNLTRHHSLIGEVMWNRLYPTDKVLTPLRLALHTTNLSGHGNLFSATANYRLQFQGTVLGTYFMGGAGMYYRNASLSHEVTTGNSIECTPEWRWWGFTCTSGTVTSNQTIASSSSFAPGVNAGFGITFKLPDSWYKIYLESRYIYAVNKFVNTQVIPITIGIRF